MAYMNRVSMIETYGVHAIRFQARARSRPRFTSSGDTERRYAPMGQKEALGASVRA